MFDLANIEKSTELANIDFHSTLGSTNDRAFELAMQDWDLPGLVLTESQTKGRGRGNNQWWSNSGSLTFSYVHELVQPNERQALAPIVAAVSVAEAIEKVSGLDNVKIKWPNDLLVDSKKLAGILIETKQSACIFGIGINVNNDQIPESTSLIHQPTSLLTILGRSIPREQLLIETLNALAQNLNSSDAPDRHFRSLVGNYNQRVAFADESISIRKPDGSTVTGICKGITNDGLLKLETNRGIVEIFSGTIKAI